MDTTHNQSFRSLWMNKRRKHDHNYSVDKLKDNDKFNDMPQFGNIHNFHSSFHLSLQVAVLISVHLTLHCTALARKYSHNGSNRRACKGRDSLKGGAPLKRERDRDLFHGDIVESVTFGRRQLMSLVDEDHEHPPPQLACKVSNRKFAQPTDCYETD